jgi:hypothetical protein
MKYGRTKELMYSVPVSRLPMATRERDALAATAAKINGEDIRYKLKEPLLPESIRKQVKNSKRCSKAALRVSSWMARSIA